MDKKDTLVIFPMDIKDDWTGIYGSKKLIDKEKYIKIKQGLLIILMFQSLNLAMKGI